MVLSAMFFAFISLKIMIMLLRSILSLESDAGLDVVFENIWIFPMSLISSFSLALTIVSLIMIFLPRPLKGLSERGLVWVTFLSIISIFSGFLIGATMGVYFRDFSAADVLWAFILCSHSVVFIGVLIIGPIAEFTKILEDKDDLETPEKEQPENKYAFKSEEQEFNV